MSEIKKNIETCRGEDVLAEVSALPQDPHFGSLVNEAFDPMQQQAAAQEGWDGYSEVIEQHKPYTFASAIIQMKSNLLLLLRALWLYPFGSGTLRSLADMWQHYITRLSGNPEHGIPSRLSSLTDLPSAPLLVADRKISCAETIDGISLQNLMGSVAKSQITSLADPNKGWACTLQMRDFINLFPALTELWLNMGSVELANDSSGYAPSVLRNAGYLKKLHFGEIEEFRGTTSYLRALFSVYQVYGGGVTNNVIEEMTFDKLRVLENACAIYTSHGNAWAPPMDELEFPVLEESTGTFGCAYCAYSGNSTLKRVSFPVIEKCGSFYNAGVSGSGMLAGTFSALEYLYIGYKDNTGSSIGLGGVSVPALDVIELKDGFGKSLNISAYNPTDKGATFLSNFRTYIALRLADNGSGKTLTLSQAVYDAIKDESHLFVFPEGTMTIYAYLTNIKHWTVTK